MSSNKAINSLLRYALIIEYSICMDPKLQNQSSIQVPQNPPPKSNKPKMFFLLFVLISSIIAFAVGGFVLEGRAKFKPQNLLQNKNLNKETSIKSKISTQIVTPTSAPVENTNLKTYINTKFDFSFNYSKSYFKHIKEFDNTSLYLAPIDATPSALPANDVWLDVTISGGDNLKSVDEYLDVMNQQLPDYYKNTIKEIVSIGNAKGYKITGLEPYGLEKTVRYQGIFLKDNHIYQIILSAHNKEALLKYEKDFDQIIESFEFVDPEKTFGVLKGKIVLGPTCPAVGPGMEEECKGKPYQAKVLVKSSDGSRQINDFSSNKDGEFSVVLAMGSYLLEPVNPTNGLPSAKSLTITIEPGKSTYSEILYDTGIR